MNSYPVKKWFVYIVDHHEGPLSELELAEQVRQSRVNRESYVWCDGMADWQLITSIPELAGVFDEPTRFVEATVAAVENPLPHSPSDELQVVGGATDLSAAATGSSVPEALEEEPTGEISVDEQTRLNEAAVPLATEKGGARGGSRRTGRGGRTLGFFLIIVCGVGVAWFQGYLDRFLPPQSRELVQKELVARLRPVIVYGSRWIPSLQSWVQSVPALPGLSPSEMQELNAVLFSGSNDGFKVTVVDASSGPTTPEFVVATNLTGRPRFEIYFEGVPETLLNTTFFGTRIQVAASDGFAVIQPFKQKGENLIPAGEYNVYVVEEDNQPKEVADQLRDQPVVSLRLPEFIPPDRKVVAVRRYFLGGEKNAQYESRLKDYHDQLMRQSRAELAELEQFQMTLEMQLSALVDQHQKLKGKPTPQSVANWKTFSLKWLKLQEQINGTISDWSGEDFQSIFFHFTLYSATRQVNERILRVRELLVSVFENKKVEAGAAIESAVQEAREGLQQLKSLIVRSKEFEPTPNGMPKRIE